MVQRNSNIKMHLKELSFGVSQDFSIKIWDWCIGFYQD